MTDIQEYVEKQKALLDLEREEEIRELETTSDVKLSELQSSGLAITRLYLYATSTSETGRQTLTLRPNHARLSNGRIATGDLVAIRAHARDDGIHGVTIEGAVTSLNETSISVAVDDTVEEWDNVPLYILKITSDVTHRRSFAALSQLERAAVDSIHPTNALLNVLFGRREPRFANDNPEHYIPPTMLKRLNDRQKEAVCIALQAKELAVVHGPPGTGKTHTVVAYICAEVARGNRVLVVAPSNVAVDNLAERLAAAPEKIQFVRCGHPARIMPEVVKYGVEAQLIRTEQAALARDIRDEIDELEGRIGKTKRKDERKALRTEQRELRKEMRRREKLALRRLLARMDVVLATISGAGARVLDVAEEELRFDVVVADEAAQALEAACWVPLLRGGKVVLAGDPFQLGGVVKSVEAEKGGLGRSILDRVFEMNSKGVVMLEVQYRMEEVISRWSSEEFYGGRLRPDESVSGRRVADLVGTEKGLMESFVVIDTAGGDCEEEVVEGGSRKNDGEAEIVKRIVKAFVHGGVRSEDIAVISPYAGQVELLRGLVAEKGVEIATVDSFQGREKEVVCMSLVRSNEEGDVGFLSDDGRMNVAITRAKRCVVVVCDSETVCHHPLLERMVAFGEEFGHYRSAVVDFEDVVGTYSQQRRPAEAIEAERSAVEKRGKKYHKQRRKPADDAGRSLAQSLTAKEDKSVKGEGVIDEQKSQVEEGVKCMLREDIVRFVEDSCATQKVFPAHLSSFERRLIHELAEEFGLRHISIQIGSSRQIKIWKKENGTQTRERAGEDTIREETSTSHIPGSASSAFGLLAGSEGDDGSSSSGEEEESSKRIESVDESIDVDHQATEINKEGGNYKSVNQLLREVSLEREARQAAATVAEDLDTVKASSSSRRGRGKRKGRGRKLKEENKSDDDFDAILAQFGANQQASGSSTRKKDLVQEIIDGKIQLPARAPQVNREAKQRLAAKLSKEAEKRTRKKKTNS